ncbi:MAG: hypothetical protein WBZ42_05540 [Halobacteriota archaeon]
MPYKDETRRREYDKAYKLKRRSEGWTKKGIDKRLTEIEVETAKDLRDLLNEVIAETRDSTSLDVEKKLRIKLRAVEIGLRVIEVTDHERRIAALEEKGNEPAPITN